MFVMMAISRSREYQADAMGAEICQRPLWLASALEKIAGAAQRIPNMAAERNPASAHMFIINPLSGERMDSLFSTHPNTENRVARLEALARDWGGQEPDVSSGPWDRDAGASPQSRGPWG